MIRNGSYARLVHDRAGQRDIMVKLIMKMNFASCDNQFLLSTRQIINQTQFQKCFILLAIKSCIESKYESKRK